MIKRELKGLSGSSQAEPSQLNKQVTLLATACLKDKRTSDIGLLQEKRKQGKRATGERL